MTAVHISSRNPFRSADITPNPTGPPASSPVTSPPPVPPRPAVDDTAGLLDELPPAYTPSPDTTLGESTIEYGPRRSFQVPPPHPVHHSHRTRPSQPPTLWSQLTGQALIPSATSSWSSYLGPLLPPDHTGYSGLTTASQSSSRLQVPRPPSPSPAATSDLVREFYAAGTGGSARSAPTSPGMYAPPAGPPPPSSPIASSPGDNKPTSIPKPGHPLLRDGKLLVYPRGYECPKCEFNFLTSLLVNYRHDSLYPAEHSVKSPNTMLMAAAADMSVSLGFDSHRMHDTPFSPRSLALS
jgi:hypothetical protein